MALGTFSIGSNVSKQQWGAIMMLPTRLWYLLQQHTSAELPGGCTFRDNIPISASIMNGETAIVATVSLAVMWEMLAVSSLNLFKQYYGIFSFSMNSNKFEVFSSVMVFGIW